MRQEVNAMSRARVIILVLCVAPGIVVACGGGDDSIGPNTRPDAGDATVDDSSGTPSLDSTPPPNGDTGAAKTIECGQATCNAGTQDCCLGPPPVCGTKGTCTGSSLSCSGTASCPTGEVCCASVERADGGRDGGAEGGGGGAQTIHAACAAMCPKGDVRLCVDVADCPQGDECRRGPDGVKVCRRAADGGKDAGLEDGSRDGGDSG
jgi:hypothetical protein